MVSAVSDGVAQAVSLGLETLDLAGFHEKTLMTLLSPRLSSKTRLRMIARAKNFFAETIAPIERTHPVARKADVRVNELTRNLRQRTVESAASSLRLEQGIARRQAAEAALEKSGKHLVLLLRESGRLQKRLRHQTRATLSTQENDRQEASRQLHDEIAQALLAIHLRLLTLKTMSRAKTKGIEKEIAETQRLLQHSVRIIQRVTRELGVHHEK